MSSSAESWWPAARDGGSYNTSLTVPRQLRYLHAQMGVHGKIWPALVVAATLTLVRSTSCLAQADPAAEPAVLAVAKVLPAVVNINTERVVRRTVRDPIEDFYAQFF
ncbi:MAG TPA: hypothetical protein VMO04_00345, partial [Chthoniobacterales bacterium]|nr:hypothetical protein [Chthoniobacterales bacterium]